MSDFPREPNWIKGADGLWHPPDEPNLEHAGPQEPTAAAPSPSWKGWLGGIALVLALAYGCGALLTSGDDNGSGRDREVSELTAFNVCKDFVRDRLKSPGSATFRNYFEDDGEVRVTRSGNTFTVRSSVDAENSFGASLRSNFECVVRNTTGDTYRLVSLDIDN